jgi:la-related protein 1
VKTTSTTAAQAAAAAEKKKKKDKKEKWVPVDINITTKRPPGKANRPASKLNSDSKNWREDAAKDSAAAGSVGGRSRARGGAIKGQERAATANGKNRINKPPIGDLVGRSGSRRGRNFSGDSSDIYPFNLDGPPAYGEAIPEPAFVTPVLQSGMAYYWNGDGQFNPTAATVAATGLASARLASEEVLKTNIKAQVEYYFSREGLREDFFLRRKMDSEGFLPVTLVASFNRVRSLTNDVTFIMQAVAQSEIVEVKDGKLRSKDDPTSWPLTLDQPDPVISPKPEEEVDNAGDAKPAPKKSKPLSLNPNVPEFVPMASKAVDPARDDDEAGTDGDDEAEIVDNQIVRNIKKTGSTPAGTPTGRQISADFDENWVEVKSKKADRKSLPKDNFESQKDEPKEELEFQFDEDLDMPAPVGRQNKFSSMNDSDSDCDELSDGEIQKLLIVTQTPGRTKKT